MWIKIIKSFVMFFISPRSSAKVIIIKWLWWFRPLKHYCITTTDNYSRFLCSRLIHGEQQHSTDCEPRWHDNKTVNVLSFVAGWRWWSAATFIFWDGWRRRRSCPWLWFTGTSRVNGWTTITRWLWCWISSCPRTRTPTIQTSIHISWSFWILEIGSSWN